MAHKTYFALLNLDYPPDHSIQLGQIITSPSEPWKRLSEPLPISEKDIQCTRKTDWGTELHRERERRAGIWASFVGMILGIGGDAVVTWSHEKSEIFQFDELETTFFEPDLEYVQQSVLGSGRENVAEWIKQNHRRSVYMVTGLKVARGAKHLRAEAKGVDFDLKPGVDATPFSGVPISAGPMVGGGRKKGESLWFSGSDDFVFAYRLRRIIIKRQAVSKSKEFFKGATVAHEDDDAAIKSGEAVALPRTSSTDEMEIHSVEQSRTDYGSGGYHLDGFKSSKVRDDEDEEECLLQVCVKTLREH